MRNVDQFRTYVEHLRIEHRRLHDRIREAENSLFLEDESKQLARAEIVERLTELRDEIARHFADEEAGGCLEEAASYCPSVGPAARDIEAEHPELLGRLDMLIARARSMKAGAPGPTLRDDFRALVSLISAHESAENRLLHQAFGMDPSDGK
jgi:hypothetical protein